MYLATPSVTKPLCSLFVFLVLCPQNKMTALQCGEGVLAMLTLLSEGNAPMKRRKGYWVDRMTTFIFDTMIKSPVKSNPKKKGPRWLRVPAYSPPLEIQAAETQKSWSHCICSQKHREMNEGILSAQLDLSNTKDRY